MTGLAVSFLFLCEGPSDVALTSHLETLLVSFGAAEATGMTDTRKGRLIDRLMQLHREGARPDLLFIHRDADGPSHTKREDEIRAAAADSPFRHAVAVIPVQETEAWLLLDEAEIRAVTGRPKGRVPLQLPKLSAIESTANPKGVLQDALALASEQSGARLKKEKKRFSEHRRVLLQRLDPLGPVRNLPSWQRLEREIQDALAKLASQ